MYRHRAIRFDSRAATEKISGGFGMGRIFSFGCEALISTPAIALILASIVTSTLVLFKKKK